MCITLKVTESVQKYTQSIKVHNIYIIDTSDSIISIPEQPGPLHELVSGFVTKLLYYKGSKVNPRSVKHQLEP